MDYRKVKIVMNFEHKSVLLSECIKGLNINSNGIYVDGTLGGAGHSHEICNNLSTYGHLIGIDQDTNALSKSKEVLAHVKNEVTFVNDNFSNVKNILNTLSIEKVDGFLLDLGVSSHQLDEPSRGFSYMHDAPLDMRMDLNSKFTAFNLINEYSENELNNIIFKYGEERWAKRIANFIVTERKVNTINTTFELVSVIKKAIPKGARIDGPHPAKRTFQAIRIEVNNELNILENTINDMINFLNVKGRICIITFHSLEDRIVKNVFRDLEYPCKCPDTFPICVCGKKSLAKVITRKPILPSEDELIENHRSRSAKLRILEKI